MENLDNYFKELLKQTTIDSMLLTMGIILILLVLEFLFFYIQWYRKR